MRRASKANHSVHTKHFFVHQIFVYLSAKKKMKKKIFFKKLPWSKIFSFQIHFGR